MKIYKLFILVLFLGLFSCEDFLEENFVSGNSTEAHYSTPEGLQTLINSCYAHLKIFYGREEGFDFSVIGTDIYDYGQQHDYKFQFQYTSDFDPAHSRNVIHWVVLYKGVNACNDALDVLIDPERTPFDENLTKIRTAEVRYLRALHNWLIVETWGGVELRDEPVRGVIKTAERHEESEFYDLILGDLDDAVTKLTEVGGDANTSSSDYGRVTLNAAKALRARARLTYASEYHTNDPALAALAAEDANDVIESGDFSLYTDYTDVWDIDNDGSGHDENIWAVNYSYTLYSQTGLDEAQLISYQRPGDKAWGERDGGNHGHLMFGSQYDVYPGMARDMEYGRPFRRYTPTRYLIEAYNDDVDQRFDKTFRTVWYSNFGDTVTLANGYKIAPGDTCIFYTKDQIDDAIQDGTINANYFWNTDKNYWCMDIDNMFNADGTTNTEECNERNVCIELHKFYDDGRAAANGAGSERGGRDFMVLRLPEMYLIAAEGYWRNSQSGEAYTLLEEFAATRAAEGVTGAEMLAGYGVNSGGDLTMDYFMDERARELCGEQIRWFDMKRLGADNMIARMQQYAGNTLARENFDAHFLLRPIPQIQLDALIDKTTFPQNPDYN